MSNFLSILDIIVTINSIGSRQMSRKGIMKNLGRTINLLLLTLITAMFICGCGSHAEYPELDNMDCQVEKTLYELAKSHVSEKSYETAQTARNYYVERVEELNALGIFLKKSDSLLWYCTIPEDFEDGDDPFESLRYEVSSKELPQTAYDSLETAKTLMCDYVDSSNVIGKEDKANINEVINSVNVNYITIDDSDPNKESALMITHGTEIFVNDSMPESCFTTHTFLHEMVHVASNITNENSKNENCYYNHCSISEAITEMLAQMIMVEADFADDFEYCVSYESDFDFALALLGRYDILEAYYYADNYEKILKGVNKDAFDLYYLAISSLGYEEKTMNNNVYVIWQQIEK